MSEVKLEYQSWIPVQRVNQLLQLEGFTVAILLLFIFWCLYLVLLGNVSPKRHRNMRIRFRRALILFILSAVFSFFQWTVLQKLHDQESVLRLISYVSLFALFLTSLLTIQLAQIAVYIYLFWANMSVGVPRLIANMFTFVFSVFLYAWLAADLFGIHLTTMLATSAIFSIVLGLALQDTLGNLFSGVALQMDKPFRIGDWVEIHHGSEKWIGQITEMTWRATSLLTFSDELIMIPNKTISQSQILVYTGKSQPVRLQQQFRINFQSDIDKIKTLLMNEAHSIQNIMTDPPPRVLITEVTESWICIKLFYSIIDYSLRYRTADELLHNILRRFQAESIQFAHQKISIQHHE